VRKKSYVQSGLLLSRVGSPWGRGWKKLCPVLHVLREGKEKTRLR
jgi:hypothetical protein